MDTVTIPRDKWEGLLTAASLVLLEVPNSETSIRARALREQLKYARLDTDEDVIRALIAEIEDPDSPRYHAIDAQELEAIRRLVKTNEVKWTLIGPDAPTGTTSYEDDDLPESRTIPFIPRNGGA